MDEMEQQIMFEMSENLQKQKQSTETIKFQIEKLLQSQAKLIQSQAKLQKNLETMMPRFFEEFHQTQETVTNPEPIVETAKNSDSFIEQLEHELVSQVVGSVPNVLLVHRVDSRVKEGEESSQQLTSGNGEKVAHQLFDQMPLRKASKEKQQTEALRSELNRMLAELKAMTANREATMPKFFSHTSILPRPPSQPPDPPDVFLPLLSELMSLKQHDDSVEMYLVKFERALSRLSLPVAHVLNIFLANMSSHLASHVRQFDVTTVSDAAWIAKRCESSLLQYSSATQSRAPFSPYQSYNDQPYYERKFGECPEIEFDRESDEIKDVKLQDKQPEEDVKTLVMSENEQSLESVDDESFNDEKSGEIIAEGTAIEFVDKSGYKVFREGNLNSLLLQEFHIVLLHFKESSDTIVPCRNLDTRALSSHFFAGGVKLLSKMVCAFLLPFLTMNIDSRTICLYSRSIFVDDAAVALRRIVEDRFVPRMEEIYLESIKQNLEFATSRGWVELWIYTHDFTLTNYGLRLSPSEYTKNTFLLVYHLSKHSASCFFLNISTGCIGALLMIYDAKMLNQLDAPTVFNDLLCKMRIVHGLEDLRQFTRAGIKFHLKHKWRSKFGSNKLTRTWTSYSRYDSSSCVRRQVKNYVMALFPIGEALTLVNDQHTLVAQKKGTETSTGCCYGLHADLDLMADVTAGTADISMDEFSSVCKLLFGVFVLNLIADQVRDWSFFGLHLQWKWHPPPQATSEFHQAHNDKPVFHL